MIIKNYVKFEFFSRPENVAFARASVAAFAAQMNCTLSDIDEIKLVISEAVSNCIIHAYDNKPNEKIVVTVSLGYDSDLELAIEDFGKGISDIQQAIQPSFSSDDTRMGMGFTFMHSFMDHVEVKSALGDGTVVRMKRRFACIAEAADA